jgi:hypothetical protein
LPHASFVAEKKLKIIDLGASSGMHHADAVDPKEEP